MDPDTVVGDYGLEKRDRQWACLYPGCSYMNYYKTATRNHSRTHYGLKPYLCKICGVRTLQSSNMIVHLKHTHKVLSMQSQIN